MFRFKFTVLRPLQSERYSDKQYTRLPMPLGFKTMSEDLSDLKKQIADLENQNLEMHQQISMLRSHQFENAELLRFERLLSELSTQLIDPSETDIRKRIEHGRSIVR